MKKFIIILSILSILNSCWVENKQTNTSKNIINNTINNTWTLTNKKELIVFNWPEVEKIIVSWDSQKAANILSEE